MHMDMAWQPDFERAHPADPGSIPGASTECKRFQNALLKISLVVESGVFQNKHTNKITWGLYNKVSQDFFDALEIGLTPIQSN